MAELASADELRHRRDARPDTHKDFYVITPEELDAIIAALEDRDQLRTALRELNSAVWRDHPQWAITVPETAKATAALEGRDG